MVERHEVGTVPRTTLAELQERGRLYLKQSELAERALDESRQRGSSREELGALATLAMRARARAEGFSEAVELLLRGVASARSEVALAPVEAAPSAPLAEVTPPPPAAPETVPAEPTDTGTLEVGARGEWSGNVGRQPDFDRVKDGRIRAQFYLAQHPDPEDREKTEWLRCYALGRHAEALQKKGRLAGAEVVVRGSFQGVRSVPRRDGTTVAQQTLYCYGVRVVRGPTPAPGQQH
jgi:hypothetical protein